MKIDAIRSLNGPQFTAIAGRRLPGTNFGDAAIRCVYLTNGARFSGFTVTNGATRKSGDGLRERSGGGLWCESNNVIISDCVIVGNAAYQLGSGSYFGSLTNCVLTSNSG